MLLCVILFEILFFQVQLTKEKEKLVSSFRRMVKARPDLKHVDGILFDSSKYNVLVEAMEDGDKSADYEPTPMEINESLMEIDDSGFLDESTQETPKRQGKSSELGSRNQ